MIFNLLYINIYCLLLYGIIYYLLYINTYIYCILLPNHILKRFLADLLSRWRVMARKKAKKKTRKSLLVGKLYVELHYIDVKLVRIFTSENRNIVGTNAAPSFCICNFHLFFALELRVTLRSMTLPWVLTTRSENKTEQIAIAPLQLRVSVNVKENLNPEAVSTLTVTHLIYRRRRFIE